MKKSLTIVMIVLLVFIAVSCNDKPQTHVHDYVDEIVKEPSCSEVGKRKYTCSICNDSYTEDISKTNHTHSKNASPLTDDYECLNVTCIQDGVFWYKCNQCGTEYREVVKASEAESKGYTVYHVSKLKPATADEKEYRIYGGYVPYTVDGKTWNEDLSAAASAEEITDPYTLANYDSAETVSKTQFTTVCQKALCASCGEELPSCVQDVLKKPTVTGTPTAADFEGVYGTWKWTRTVTGTTNTGDTIVLNMRVYADETSGKDKVEVYASKYDADAASDRVLTKKLTADAVGTWKYTSGSASRTLTFSLTGLTGIESTDIDSKIVTLEEKDGKVVLTGIGAADTSDEGKEDDKIEYLENHTEHKMNVMTHLGLPYIVEGTGQHTEAEITDVKFKKHFLECTGCGISYYGVEHTKETEACGEAETTGSLVSTKTCDICGYDMTDKAEQEGKTRYFALTVNSVTMFVPENSVLELPYDAYTNFNGEKKTIKTGSGWKVGGQIEVFEGKYKVTGIGTLTTTFVS